MVSISPVGSCFSCFPQSWEEHISGCALFSLVSVTLTHLCKLVNFNEFPGSVVIEQLLVFFFLNTPQCAIYSPASVCLCSHKGIVGHQPMQRRACGSPKKANDSSPYGERVMCGSNAHGWKSWLEKGNKDEASRIKKVFNTWPHSTPDEIFLYSPELNTNNSTNTKKRSPCCRFLYLFRYYPPGCS